MRNALLGSLLFFASLGCWAQVLYPPVPGGGAGVTWPAPGDAVLSNGTNTPAGLAPVNGDCILGSGGAWTAGTCGSSLPSGTQGEPLINTTGSTTYATSQILIDASQFTGGIAEKINACITAAIGIGGTCDARALGEPNAASAGIATAVNTDEQITVGDSAGDPVTLLLPANFYWTGSMTDGTSCTLAQYGNTSIIGQGTANGNAGVFGAANTSNLGYVYCAKPATGGANYYYDFGFSIYNYNNSSQFKGHATANNVGSFIQGPVYDQSTWDHMAFFDGADTYDLEMYGVCCSAKVSSSSINANYLGIPLYLVSNSGGTGSNVAINFNDDSIEHNISGSPVILAQDTGNNGGSLNFTKIYTEAYGGGATGVFEFSGYSNVSLDDITFKAENSVGSNPVVYSSATVNTSLTTKNLYFSNATGTFTYPITAVSDAYSTTTVSATTGTISGTAQLPFWSSNPLPAAQTATTQAISTNNTSIATTAAVTTALIPYAPLASPTFTGTPAAPTPATSTNTTQLATAAMVQAVGANLAPNSNAFYLAQNCGTQANCTQANANTKQCNDASITNSSETVTSTACANFTSADVGKRIWAFTTCATDAGAISAPSVLVPIIGSATAATISAVNSATSITISQNATGTQATTGCIIYGSPDDTAQSNIETAMTSSSVNFCPGEQLPAGGMMWTSWHLALASSSFPGCARNPEVSGSTAMGGGFNVGGQGRTQSVIYIDPLISIAGCAATGCMLIPQNGVWHDFSFNGGQASRSGVSTVKNLIYPYGYTEIINMGFTNLGWADQNLVGMYLGVTPPVWCINSDFDGWGAITVELNGAWLQSEHCDYQDSLGGSTLHVASIYLNATSGSQFYSLHDIFVGNNYGTASGVGGPPTLVYNNSPASYVKLSYGNLSAQSPNYNTTGYSQISTGTAWLTGMLTRLNAAASQVNVGVYAGTSANIYLKDNIWQVGADGYVTNCAATSATVHDMGGNVLFSGVGILEGTCGSYIGNSSNATAITAAKLVLSSGWGSTAANTALSGGNSPIQFTITNSGTGQAASPTITYTFPTPYPVAPFSCTATQAGGTNAAGTFTSGATSTTGVTFTYSLTPTVSDTEIVQVSCVTP